MHPRVAELMAYLDQQRIALETAVAAIPAADLTRAPEPGRWSVAQVLEHLVLIERNLATLFRRWLTEHRRNGLAGEEDSRAILPRIDIARTLDRSRRITTGASMEPTGQLAVPDAWPALDRARHELTEALAIGDGLALSEIVRPHPALGPLNMYEWIAFVGSHMARHTAQIREIADTLRASE